MKARKDIWFNEKLEDMQDKVSYFLEIKSQLKPWLETLKIIGVYIFIGVLWISFSDKILSLFVTEPESLSRLQTYKGWFYVIITGIIFYIIIVNKIILFNEATDKIFEGYKELSSVHKELLSMENKLHSLAYFDTLTGLPNRQHFETILERYILDSNNSNNTFMFLYIDLDNFKNVNDTLGHGYGDELIKIIAMELKKEVGDNVIARLGGDEFGVIFPFDEDFLEVGSKIAKLQSIINKLWAVGGNDLYMTSSVGVTIFPCDGRDVKTLMKNADTAMYVAKDISKNCYAFYTPEMNEKASNYMVMEKDIRNALASNEFILYYQPIINIKNNNVVGVEALIRWNHPKKGIVSPIDFIPFAEDSGLITQIGEDVIRMACTQIRAWSQEGYSNVTMSINLSAKQLRQHDLIETLNRYINEYDINCDNLIFEITENAALSNLNQSIDILKRLKAMGIKIALDDFGTGYSSLNYLKQLPVDIIKMDKSFIKDIFQEKERYITKTVIDLAHNLGLLVTAEGIESTYQLDILSDYGCDHGQGYYFSKPLAPEELSLHLRSSV